MTQLIDEDVDVRAFYFVGKDLKTFPRQIEYGGRAITFADGLRVQLQRAGQLTCLFDMNGADGATYRLRQEGNRWTLVGAA